MTKHWTHIAADRIDAGEDEIECLADYGYVPVSQLDVSRNAHAELVVLRAAHENLKERHEALRRQYAAKDAYTGKVNDENQSLRSYRNQGDSDE